ncbi:hypothetical protein [Jiangella muralis]|uniref:hypothetical protein n=1 Tax=Jiangella muralis TaxID=702383 RepID=UPI00069F6B57|nr:hypothetical protein [Jiangella muralis]
MTATPTDDVTAAELVADLTEARDELDASVGHILARLAGTSADLSLPAGTLGMTVDQHSDQIATHDIRLRRLEAACDLTSRVLPDTGVPEKVVVPGRDSYFTGLWVGAGCGIAAVIAALGIVDALGWA